MARKLIHPNFQIDLSLFKVTHTEKNDWFEDTFSSKISYPFEMDLDDDFDKAVGFLSLYNTKPETEYAVKLLENNKISDARFEITSCIGRKLQCIYESGLEAFPNFDKKLKDLPLLNITLPSGTTIYAHAKSIIDQKWPAIGYNFPAIHAPFIDKTVDKFANFDGFINHMEAGEFVENSVVWESPNFEFQNRNIMQPAVSLLYILEEAMADAGFTLSGDILTDPVVQKEMWFTPTEDYYGNWEIEEYSIKKTQPDGYESEIPVDFFLVYQYVSTLVFPPYGLFNLVGTVKGFFPHYAPDYHAVSIFVNGVLVYSGTLGFDGTIVEALVNINFLSTASPGDVIQVVSYTEHDPVITNVVYHDLEILPILLLESDGTPIPSVINEPIVNLKKAVPDMTVGEVFTYVKNHKNYSFTPIGNTIVMNKVEPEINYNNAISLQNLEVKEPERKFQSGLSFLLRFNDIDNKDYVLDQVYHDSKGFSSAAAFNKTAKTKEIVINALPLPFVQKSGVTTALCFHTNNAIPQMLLYDGRQLGINTTLDNTPILLPAMHLSSFRKWFDFRINAVPFKWAFKAFATEITDLTAKNKIFAYGRYHFVKTIVKTEYKPDYFEVDLDTESFN